MAANPYQHPQGEDDGVYAQSPRTSALAVSSLVFGIVCCLPGTGLLATILGGAGLVRISQSQGRLSGRVMSFIGVALGLLSTMFWLAIVVGASQAVQIAKGRIFEPAGADLRAMESGDWATARRLLDKKTSSAVTDDQFKAFRDEVADKFGPFVGIPQRVDWNKLFGQQPNISTPPGVHTVLPFPVDFKKGQAWVVVVSDSADTIGEIFFEGKSVDGSVSNVGVIGEGKEVWLIDPSAAGKPGPKGQKGPTSSPAPKPGG
jgi:hypothetical protein